jgi:hypothetical protein
MDDIVRNQLDMVSNMKFTVDNDSEKGLNEPFSEVVFNKVSVSKDSIKVIFEDYFINPYPGFDFHERFHNKTPPYAQIMYGKIEKETDKMYYFKVHSDVSSRIWEGYCPKKSCKVFNI